MGVIYEVLKVCWEVHVKENGVCSHYKKKELAAQLDFSKCRK